MLKWHDKKIKKEKRQPRPQVFQIKDEKDEN